MIRFLALMLVSSLAVAQGAECIQDEKPHFYRATGTVQTQGTTALRTFSEVSPALKDLAACGQALEFLRAQTGIAPKGAITKKQFISYEGSCIAAELCP